MSSIGTTTVRSKVLSMGGCTTVTGRPPARNVATSSTGRTVAESPIRWAGWSSRASRRSSETARCAPRLVAHTAVHLVDDHGVDAGAAPPAQWTSAAENSDSGVVIRMSAGWRAKRAALVRRGVAGSHGDRDRPARGRPMRIAACRMPASGARRLRSTSTASAFSGLTYSTRHRRIGSSGTGRAASRSSAERNAANVLPEPVGATTSA